MEGTMIVMLERPDSGANPMQITVQDEDYFAVREAMFEFQKYTEATTLVAVDEEGKRIATLTFDWNEEYG